MLTPGAATETSGPSFEKYAMPSEESLAAIAMEFGSLPGKPTAAPSFPAATTTRVPLPFADAIAVEVAGSLHGAVQPSDTLITLAP